MADFCKQCSEELFDEDFGDFKGLCTEDNFAEVLCEGCGLDCVVDHEGRCVAEDCISKHGKEKTKH